MKGILLAVATAGALVGGGALAMQVADSAAGDQTPCCIPSASSSVSTCRAAIR